MPRDAAHAEFCCSGCKAVHGLLSVAGLGRFYDLRGGAGQPVGTVPQPARRQWLEVLEERGRLVDGQVRLVLDVQGIHCAACVWVLEELWRRRPGAFSMRLNPAVGQAEFVYDPSVLDLGGYLDEVERLGYRVAPESKRSGGADTQLLVRLGVCVALALNAMLFALAGYLGMSEADGFAFHLFRWLAFGFATLAVGIGGPVFFRGAVAGLRRRVLHLDLPISAGIVLAYGGSVSCLLTGSGESYFDTVTIFVALMLLGRYLQVRAVRRNRDYLLANDGAEHLAVRRLRGVAVETIPVTDIAPGDRLLLAPGDLVPVRAELCAESAALSLDWINGESMPRRFERTDILPAGAFVAGTHPLEVEAVDDVEGSGLLAMLAGPADTHDDLRGRGRFWSLLSRFYVTAVLLIAALACTVWLFVDPARALEVTTAVLVVTCPCALGLATPLAFEMAVARLRRIGVYVRQASLFERARHVAKVVFDKTGTLTWGAVRARPLREVSADCADILWTMVCGSRHPVSLAVAAELAGERRFVHGMTVEEVPGSGLRAERDGVEYRVGSSEFVLGSRAGGPGAGLCLFARNGHVEACFALEEELRSGARDEIEELERRGYAVHVLSGDVGEKVDAVAEQLGIPSDRAIAAQGPEQKAQRIRELGAAETLMVGDGINDAPAFEAACCAGTPALDSPVMPGRADFFFRGRAGAVAAVLETSHRLHRVVRANLALAVAYNVVAIGLAVAGLMSPLLCAVVMPLSSLALIGHTGLRMRRPVIGVSA